ncbi:MAG: hypothetical protein JNK05_26575 [Myxococcales bacterium]|nr:hypothetical protein [Myxococcales bacterium]
MPWTDALRGDWWTPSVTIAAYVLATPYAIAMLLRPADDEVVADVRDRLREHDWPRALEAARPSRWLSSLLSAVGERRLDEATADRAYRSASEFLDAARATALLRARFETEIDDAFRGRMWSRAGAVASLVVLLGVLSAHSTSVSWSWAVLVACCFGAIVVSSALGVERYARARLWAGRDALVELVVPFATGAKETRAG